MELDEGWRGGEGDGGHRAEVPDVVEFEERVLEGQPLSEDAPLSVKITRDECTMDCEDLPHGVADGNDVVGLRLDLTDPARVREDCLGNGDFRRPAIKERESPRGSTSDELSGSSEVLDRERRGLLKGNAEMSFPTHARTNGEERGAHAANDGPPIDVDDVHLAPWSGRDDLGRPRRRIRERRERRGRVRTATRGLDQHRSTTPFPRTLARWNLLTR